MNKKSKVPLYLQLMEDLIKQIKTQKYRENEKLPSERELCEIYGLSRITVRQTLQELEQEGFIYKLHGKGTFVAPKSYNQHLVKLYSFTEEMKAIGKQPTTKVISFREIAASESLAGKMELHPNDDVFQIVRLRLADEEPLMYETSYVPKQLFPGITKATLMERAMYDIFYEDYGIGVSKALEHFSATMVREEEATQLQMHLGHPAMLIKRYAYQEEQLIEYTISVARGDKFDYTVELT